MEVFELEEPLGSYDENMIFRTDIVPLDKLAILSPGEFEDMVLEWAYSFLTNKYKVVRKMGGGKDKGRDIVGYYANGDIDIYQCKHYNSPIKPSDFWVELGKLCYYTFNKDYPIPSKYYIVSSKGVGPKLADYISNPIELNKLLLSGWEQHCKNSITKEKVIELTDSLTHYIKTFDFSIVEELPPLKLLDEYSKTKWYKYRFGGGLVRKHRPPATTPVLDENEICLKYVAELIEVYKEETDGKVVDIESLNNNGFIKADFNSQRFAYHSAQALKRFTRDEFLNEQPYVETKEQVYHSVLSKTLRKYESSFSRVTETLEYVRLIPLEIFPFGIITPLDKCGLCHELVNEERLKWVSHHE